jgi:hypothetical protein
MSSRNLRSIGVLGLVLAVAGLLAVMGKPLAEAADSAEVKSDPAVERARRQVKMLDDLYKTTIVFITNTYVDTDKDVAAGEIARDLFAAMREKGWHDARLLDATGHPTNDENVAKSSFEKAAVKKILAGETYVDEITTEKGKQYLQAATVVPVVNAKCIVCHPGWKVGQVIGAVSYKLPID